MTLGEGGAPAGPVGLDVLDLRGLQCAVDVCPLPALLADAQPGGRVLGTNPELMRLFGGGSAELARLDAVWGRAVPGGAAGVDAAECWSRALQAAAERNSPTIEPFELRVARLGGSPRLLRVRASLAGPWALLVFAEVSAPAPPQEELVEAYHLLQQIMDTSPGMIFVKEASGRLRFVNRYAAEYYGVRSEQMLRRTTPEVHATAAEAERFDADDQEVRSTGKMLVRDELNTAHDGQKHWFRTLKVPFVRTDGTVDVLGLAADITPLKETEAALRNSEEKLRLAVVATRLGLWQWDIQNDSIEWDDTMLEIWGLTRDSLPQERSAYMELIHPEDAEKMGQAIQTALATGRYPPMEHRVVRPDGSIRHVAAQALITRAPDGSLAKLMGSARDVTEERELEARRQAAQRLESIGQLSAGVAHNFNNLLMGIIPNLDLALPGASPWVAELLQAAREAALRAAELVGQMTTFAGRAQGGPRRAEDARELVERALAMCRGTFDRSIELVARYPERSHFVSVDATRFEQVLLNVLINARDAVADPAIRAPALRITLDTVAKGESELARLGLRGDRDYVRIRISDNGIGMTASVRGRIFEPFFSTKAPGHGTGLGLSTAIAIVREHEGAIDCASMQGAGSTFGVFLPEAAPEARARVVAAPRAPVAAREAILVVDDEAAVREVVHRLLTREGYVTHVASCADDALQSLADTELRRSIALVILDMSMPGMSGQQALGELRQLLPDTPIVFFTGYTIDAPEGADGFIRKPITAAKLAQAVREVLESARARRAQR